MNNFWTRVISGIGMIALVVFLINNGPYGITLLTAIIGVGCHFEWLKLKGNLNAQNLTISFIFFFIILFFKQIHLSEFGIMIKIFINTLLVFLGITHFQKTGKYFNKTLVLSHLYISIPLLLFTLTPYSKGFLNQYNAMLPLMLMVLVWSSDSWAYVSGKLFGKHKLAPSISPGKTWEGLIGGTILTGITGFLFVTYVLEPNGGLIGSNNFHTFNQIKGLILGIFVSIFGTLGDLFESSLKRKAGVKDSGNVLPGHGGMLDRFDAFLFAIVVFTIVSRIP